ncbi:MAG: hypothetical protein CBE00_05985 [Planctomycetaceae bacterium TMED240]|nr:MAG: hypothetical protein CBE00_05985 [Planctomycetaceae bacterium TMED240]
MAATLPASTKSRMPKRFELPLGGAAVVVEEVASGVVCEFDMGILFVGVCDGALNTWRHWFTFAAGHANWC